MFHCNFFIFPAFTEWHFYSDEKYNKNVKRDYCIIESGGSRQPFTCQYICNNMNVYVCIQYLITCLIYYLLNTFLKMFLKVYNDNFDKLFCTYDVIQENTPNIQIIANALKT